MNIEQIIESTIIEFNDSGMSSATALRRNIVGNLEKSGYQIELSKLSQHDVIKNEVAVCDYPWHEKTIFEDGFCYKCGSKDER